MPQPTYTSQDGLFSLYKGDTFHILKEINYVVDMIFADPPYFLSTGNSFYANGRKKYFDKGGWDKARPIAEVDDFNMEWLSLCRGILKDNGTIWVSGTYHNIYSVANCMVKLGYKILNVIVWQKPNAPYTLSHSHFNFSAEYIIWARKGTDSVHYFNYDLMCQINGGKRMSDVWSIPTVEPWEKRHGKHPTQKPLKLLYRIIQSCTKSGETVLDPFSGSSTTGIASYLLNRKFIGIEQDESFIDLSIKRFNDLSHQDIASNMRKRMAENADEPTVIINHARKELYNKMIETGICYLRAGDSKGSLLVRPGFERLQYVLLHSSGNNPKMFKLKNKGQFQIWTKETLQKYGFAPEHSPYYVVLLFDNKHEILINPSVKLTSGYNTCNAKLRPISEFIIQQ